jgi:hypothetical protein
MKAYPYQHRHPTTGVTTSSEGIDLRDYFAAMAMQAYCSVSNSNWTVEEIAADAYSQADAMMKTRSKQDEQC